MSTASMTTEVKEIDPNVLPRFEIYRIKVSAKNLPFWSLQLEFVGDNSQIIAHFDKFFKI